MIISVPMVLNCFHSDAFSSSILTLPCGVEGASWGAGAGGGGSRRGGRARAAASHEEGYRGTWAEATSQSGGGVKSIMSDTQSNIK